MSRALIEQIVGWVVVAGIVGAVWLGRRRGKQNLANQIAAAHAAGFAEGGAAAAHAHAQQSVTVAVDASRRGVATDGGQAHSCVDPWGCVECGPVLLAVAKRQRERELAASYGPADDERAAFYLASIDGADREQWGVPVARGRLDGARAGGAGGAADRHGLDRGPEG